MIKFFSRTTSRAILIVLAAAALGSAACSFGNRTAIREMQTDTETVQPGAATSAQVTLKMGPGDLKLTGGAAALMNATFRYNVPDWKPRLSYSVQDGKGFLTVQQSGSTGTLDSGAHNEWNVSLNDQIPLDMRIEIGAGKTDLTLGTLSLGQLELQEGAGESAVDLRGNWKKNVTVWIEGGVGKTTVQLPQDVGAKVEVEQGIGAVKAGSLKKQDGAYVNAAYGKSPATVSVNIKSGVGEVDLQEGPPEAN